MLAGSHHQDYNWMQVIGSHLEVHLHDIMDLHLANEVQIFSIIFPLCWVAYNIMWYPDKFEHEYGTFCTIISWMYYILICIALIHVWSNTKVTNIKDPSQLVIIAMQLAVLSITWIVATFQVSKLSAFHYLPFVVIL